MMTYLDRVLQDMSDGCHFPPGFSDLIKDKLQLMMTGVAIVIKRFRDRELKETWTNLLVKEILEPMIEEGIRNRFLLQSTTGYWNGNDAYPLQGVVPYYSLPLDMFSSIALLERINGLETKEK
jgi:hypothetical protein